MISQYLRNDNRKKVHKAAKSKWTNTCTTKIHHSLLLRISAEGRKGHWKGAHKKEMGLITEKADIKGMKRIVEGSTLVNSLYFWIWYKPYFARLVGLFDLQDTNHNVWFIGLLSKKDILHTIIDVIFKRYVRFELRISTSW